MSAMYLALLNSTSVGLSASARPAGLANNASAPFTEPTFEWASPTLRAPTMIRASGFPPVPRRSSVPAWAAPASTRLARTATSTFPCRAFMFFAPPSCRVEVRGSPHSEVVEALLLHEDGHLAGGR